VSRPASALRSTAALTALELRLAARRGENILVTLVIPVAVLLFFAGRLDVGPGLPEPGAGARLLLPGTMALAIVASGLVSLGIATAYERHYGVLKRLGGAPITRGTLLVAKLVAVAGLVAVQLVLLVSVARLALGWSSGPAWSPALLIGAIALGTLAFVALGLLLAGTLRAEATLGVANGLFLVFLMLGGILGPVSGLPDWLQPIATLLPVTALADLLRAGLDAGGVVDAPRSAAILAAWAAAAVALTARWFRWD
jgi:ABC-2 type transport system permease protein